MTSAIFVLDDGTIYIRELSQSVLDEADNMAEVRLFLPDHADLDEVDERVFRRSDRVVYTTELLDEVIFFPCFEEVR